jgi:hypothetical protein
MENPDEPCDRSTMSGIDRDLFIKFTPETHATPPEANLLNDGCATHMTVDTLHGSWEFENSVVAAVRKFTAQLHRARLTKYWSRGPKVPGSTCTALPGTTLYLKQNIYMH